MPVVSRYRCTECDFGYPVRWGGYTYATDEHGQRIACAYPVEFERIRELVGLDYWEARRAGRAGFASCCICLECLRVIYRDLEIDAAGCPGCSSPQIRTLRELIGKNCPACKRGLLEIANTGPWQPDADWESLTVPPIVKDLADFVDRSRKGNTPASLRKAAEVAGDFSAHTLRFLAITLLDWWEGGDCSKDGRPRESLEIPARATWAKALAVVLEVTPELAELVFLRDGRCWFTATSETRRGIKNYLRKHRNHVIRP